jgi:hypothetical protein
VRHLRVRGWGAMPPSILIRPRRQVVRDTTQRAARRFYVAGNAYGPRAVSESTCADLPGNEVSHLWAIPQSLANSNDLCKVKNSKAPAVTREAEEEIGADPKLPDTQLSKEKAALSQSSCHLLVTLA